jgi:hypothetical protein
MHVMFPHNVRHNAHSLRQVGQSSDGVQGIDGVFTAQPRLGGHWRATASFWATNEATSLALQAFVAGMEGMLGTTDFPVFQRYAARDVQGHVVGAFPVGSIGNGHIWEGRGSEAAQHFGLANAPVVFATVADAAASRATRLRVLRSATAGVRPGQFFSIGARLYQVQLLWQDAAGVDVVQITPPLREAVPAGAMMVLDAPVCRMRFATADEGVQAFTLDGAQQVTFQMIEAI